ncbi:MAG: phosphopyruvate hydratase [Patescibacteria group bacterium]|jgi:enolase|nr:phosphopyruvate hydratase [bacterium]HQC49894.1 phosphopyruvate hydratase [bacterium]
MSSSKIKIKKITAREILDSRSQPTIEACVILSDGTKAIASVPSGSSIGTHEAFEFRDGDSKRYFGRGVLRAIRKIEEIIAPELKGQDIFAQKEIDDKLIALDGTAKKTNLGANTILAVSLACARAGALAKKQELFTYLQDTFSFSKPTIPVPLFNIFNGGKHADTNLDFQEFLVIPKRSSAKEMVQIGAEIFRALGAELKSADYDTDVGIEGGYAPDLDSSIEALELIIAGALRAGYDPKKDFYLGIDVGSSVLYEAESNHYVFSLDQSYFTTDNLIGLYESWLRKYPIIYLEDGLAEDDWEGWRGLTADLGDNMLIVGDDLFVTSTDRLRRGLKEKAANAIIIKPNQVGTLSEAVDCIKLAKKHDYQVIISHRSGETNDDFIVDLAVACGAEYLKAGSLSRGERVAKYNRLMEIEDLLSKK